MLYAGSTSSWMIGGSHRSLLSVMKTTQFSARDCGLRLDAYAPDINAATLLELKQELLDLLGEIPNRGLGADPDDAIDVLEIIQELEELNPCRDWANAPQLGGRWRLRYTSSKTFENNKGLTGYARDVSGVETPELFMTIQTNYRLLQYEEPLQLQEGSLAAMLGKFAGINAVVAECTWLPTSSGGFGGMPPP